MISAQAEQLAMRARQLMASGQLQAAREAWVTVLNMLPFDAPERRGVEREIARIDERLHPKPKVDWAKRLGPLGVVVAFLAKFKTAALLLLKFKFFFSMLAFVGFYWMLFGWWFALGFTASVFIHEMGHFIAVKRFGFKAELPMFIPGLGAYVKWQGANIDPNIRSQISLAGPLFGLFSGIASYALFQSTHSTVWLGVAQFAGWLNLINLIPVTILDGGGAIVAVGKAQRVMLMLVCALFAYLCWEGAFLFVALGTAYRLWKRDEPARGNATIGYAYMAIAVANGLLSWFCMNQARLLIPMQGAN